MCSAPAVALEFDPDELFYFATPRIIPENSDMTNGFWYVSLYYSVTLGLESVGKVEMYRWHVTLTNNYQKTTRWKEKIKNNILTLQENITERIALCSRKQNVESSTNVWEKSNMDRTWAREQFSWYLTRINSSTRVKLTRKKNLSEFNICSTHIAFPMYVEKKN